MARLPGFSNRTSMEALNQTGSGSKPNVVSPNGGVSGPNSPRCVHNTTLPWPPGCTLVLRGVIQGLGSSVPSRAALQARQTGAPVHASPLPCGPSTGLACRHQAPHICRHPVLQHHTVAGLQAQQQVPVSLVDQLQQAEPSPLTVHRLSLGPRTVCHVAGACVAAGPAGKAG